MGFFEDAGAWFNQAGADVVNFVGDAVDDVGDALVDVGSAVESAVQSAGQAVGQVAQQAAQVVGQVAQQAAQVVGQVAATAVDAVSNAAAFVVDEVGQAADAAVSWLEEAAQSVGEAVDSVFNGPDTASSIETGGLIRTDWDDSFTVTVYDDENGDGINDWDSGVSSSGFDWQPALYVEGSLFVPLDAGNSDGGVSQGTAVDNDFASSDRSLETARGVEQESGNFDPSIGDAAGLAQADLVGSIYVKYGQSVDLDVSAVDVFDTQQQKDVGVSQQELVDDGTALSSSGMKLDSFSLVDLDVDDIGQQIGVLDSQQQKATGVLQQDLAAVVADSADVGWKFDESLVADLDLSASEQQSPAGDRSVLVSSPGDAVVVDDSVEFSQFAESPMVIADIAPNDDFSNALLGTEAVVAEVDNLWDDIG